VSAQRPLEHRVALVTGAAQGIGAAIACGLAEQGARVVCGDLAAPEATADAIRAAGGQADALTLDVTSTADVGAAINFVAAGIGGLDILVNNAGIFPRSPALELDEATWDRVLDVNLKGTFFCAQAAARLMVEQARGGRIVNITSGAAFVPTPQSSHYAASKAGVVAATRVLALELASAGITVNAVAPGLTDTAQPRSFYSDDDLAAIAARIPLGRIAAPAEIVPAVCFLAGEGAGYITGMTVHVNGGLYMP
jgi:NAD(P)-dependent dehydrogenase (short-subunit alcohol dehydrogenase family)